MKFEFDKLPITTLIGANWRTFKAATKGQEIDKGYKLKYCLTKIICRLMSSLNFLERKKYNKLLANKALKHDPVFILGHWRSGTTFVHNVLSCDKQFGYTTTYQTVFPNAVLTGQSMFKPIMKSVMPDKRPVDGLELQPDLPQEEEFALSGTTPFSYYNFWFFPRKMMEYCNKYLLMQELTLEEKCEFKDAFLRLVKTSLYNTKADRYLSKNPPHTGRVATLLEMFPNAKFIYLIRNPYTVFESTNSFFCGTIKPLMLQNISDDKLQEQFVEAYKLLYDKYQSDKVLIPEGNLIEMRFEDFEADPIAATKKIYESLSLDGFNQALPEIEKYVGKKKGHRKNKYKYAQHTIDTVEKHWGKTLSDWGYYLES